jgi:hypothetical protein
MESILVIYILYSNKRRHILWIIGKWKLLFIIYNVLFVIACNDHITTESNILWKSNGDNNLAVNYLIKFVIKVLFMTPNYVTITITVIIYVIFLHFILVLIFLLILDNYMIICSLLVGFYATCNGYFIKLIYIN